MGTAVILGNGEFPRREYPRYLLDSAGLVVCCDGAFARYLRYRKGELPASLRIVGDMDSLPKQLRKRYADRIIHIAEQDDNDQTKAVRYILDHYPEIDTIHILGATGRREDHTLGNLSLLMEYARTFPPGRADIDIVSDYGTAFAITDSCDLYVGEGRAVSLFSPDNSLRITSEGLEWPTDEVVFDNWWKATLNRATADRIRLRFSHPSIALLFLG